MRIFYNQDTLKIDLLYLLFLNRNKDNIFVKKQLYTPIKTLPLFSIPITISSIPVIISFTSVIISFIPITISPIPIITKSNVLFKTLLSNILPNISFSIPFIKKSDSDITDREPDNENEYYYKNRTIKRLIFVKGLY